LPPQAHGHTCTLVFVLITPAGGFHWVPLDESPRPIKFGSVVRHCKARRL
jgi:hypothetical protein